ncbi:MAG: hypothetical protein IPM03_22190 [Sulfuritalea sp.]|nr:hypothetical protein [Sulfuritalea sp.]
MTITGATGNGTALTGLTITGNDISLGNIGGAAAGVSGATSVTAADGAGPTRARSRRRAPPTTRTS